MSDPGKETEDLFAIAHEWRLRLESADVTEQERLAFDEWLAADPYHPEVYDKAVTMWEALSHVTRSEIAPNFSEPPLLGKPVGAIDHSMALTLKRWLFSRQFALGAGVVAAMGFAFIMANSMNTDRAVPSPIEVAVTGSFESEVGQTRTINLADGSLVTLGPASRIETEFFKSARNVRLTEGVAVFDVESDPNRPFSVYSGDLTVTALGTSFEVKTGSVLRVAVAEGRVEVQFPLTVNGEVSSLITKRELSSGQGITADVDRGMRSSPDIDVSNIGAWQSGRLVYSNAQLRELIADANRYSDIPIEIIDNDQGIEMLPVRGAFDSDNIEAMLTSLEAVLPIAIDRSDPNVVKVQPE